MLVYIGLFIAVVRIVLPGVGLVLFLTFDDKEVGLLIWFLCIIISNVPLRIITKEIIKHTRDK